MRSQVQLERCEAMRRLQIDRYRKATLVRCDMVAVPVVETVYDEKTSKPAGEQTVTRHEPKCAAVLRAAGIPWGQVWRRETAEQLIWFEHEMPEDLKRLTGVASEKADALDFDALIKPFADRAVGHFSYAHTQQVGATYTFDTAYNPASDDPNWTHTRNGAVENAYITSGHLRGSISYIDAYTYDPLSVMGVADYSVEANCTQNSSYDHGLVGRGGNGNNNDPAYWLLMDNGRFDIVYRHRSHTATGEVLIASKGASLGTGLCRLEMVGSTLKGYHSGAEQISGTDTTIEDALRPGAFADYGTRIDNFAVYIDDGINCPGDPTDQDGSMLATMATNQNIVRATASTPIQLSAGGAYSVMARLGTAPLTFKDGETSRLVIVRVRRRLLS